MTCSSRSGLCGRDGALKLWNLKSIILDLLVGQPLLLKMTVEFQDVCFKFFDFVSEFVYLNVKTLTFIEKLAFLHLKLQLQVFEKPARKVNSDI